jgi:catechol 2,3-dioxygenase-like lactoylglutathione lyase family enzyme
MKRDDFPAPREGMVLTHFLTVKDQERSRAFYADVLGGQVVVEHDPCIIKLANTWVILNVGGGPTEDKPEVTLSPPADLNQASSFMNIRVADIKAKYDEWRSKGAEFLTPPLDRGAETRCYMRDPDGHLIEVGEATGILQMFEDEADG